MYVYVCMCAHTAAHTLAIFCSIYGLYILWVKYDRQRRATAAILLTMITYDCETEGQLPDAKPGLQ